VVTVSRGDLLPASGQGQGLEAKGKVGGQTVRFAGEQDVPGR
jgi:hypothetical protein